ncbi:unnamed protein product [Moneuplotes crassus]|uniref:Cyclic nucleotide-binding domain-containing protein n=1 Tax=Euplotes crassus TaxID=5936 RepID=A0AAD1XR35_EUPCR|nr:unnamed protein product [Moneuplotes crassus]
MAVQLEVDKKASMTEFQHLRKLKAQAQLSKKPSKCMIRYSSGLRLYWDCWIILLAIWNSLYIPYDIAFQPPLSSSILVVVLNALIDFNFLIDIFLTFRTTYYDVDGEEVFEAKKIAKKYLFGRFSVDLISTVPLDSLGNLPVLQTFQLLKLFRLSRISKIIKNLPMKEDIKVMIKVLNLVFMLFIYIHCIACLDFLIVNSYKNWCPPLWYYSCDNNDLYTSSNLRQYAISLYISILLFGGNEIGGTNEAELAFTGMVMLFSAIVNALIFGEMAVLVEAISRRETEFQEKIDTTNSALKNLCFPLHSKSSSIFSCRKLRSQGNDDPSTNKDICNKYNRSDTLQEEVRDFLIYTQGTLEQQEEMAQFFEVLSSSLKMEVSQQIFESVARNNNIIMNLVTDALDEYSKTLFNINNIADKERALFNKEREIIQSFVKYLTVELKSPEDTIITQNSKTRDMYYVANGVCCVTVTDYEKKVNTVRHLLPGNHFGEIGMIYGTPRTASVFSKNYCTLAKMTVEVFNEVITDYPFLVTALKEHIYTVYDDPMTSFCFSTLERIPYFQGVGNEAIYDAIYTLTKRFCKKGEIIQKVDEEATTMYILINGIVEIYTQFEGNNFVLERLWKGSVINYRTFWVKNDIFLTPMSQRKTSAQEYKSQVSIRCMTKSILLELKYNEMMTLVKSNEELEKKFLKFQKQFFLEKKSYPLDYVMNLPESHFGQEDIEEKYAAIKRENIFKNVVMRRIKEIKELKAKPKILQHLEGKKISDWKAKIQAKRRIQVTKEIETAQQFQGEETDKFARLVAKLERTIKAVTADNIVLDNIEEKIIEISNTHAAYTKQQNHLQVSKKSRGDGKPTRTKIQAFERIKDEEYGVKNLIDGIDITNQEKEELEFSFSSQSSIP